MTNNILVILVFQKERKNKYWNLGWNLYKSFSKDKKRAFATCWFLKPSGFCTKPFRNKTLSKVERKWKGINYSIFSWKTLPVLSSNQNIWLLYLLVGFWVIDVLLVCIYLGAQLFRLVSRLHAPVPTIENKKTISELTRSIRMRSF